MGLAGDVPSRSTSTGVALSDVGVCPAFLSVPSGSSHLVPSHEIHTAPTDSLVLASKPQQAHLLSKAPGKNSVCFLSSLYPDVWTLHATSWVYPSRYIHLVSLSIYKSARFAIELEDLEGT